jgi:dihydroorotate dehydrogenase electron transfer subunit
MSEQLKAKEIKAEIIRVERVKSDVFLLVLNSHYLAANAYPGQFVHVYVHPAILRRPFSIHNVKQDKIYLLFKVRGKGTQILSSYNRGDIINVIGPLGKGFTINSDRKNKRIKTNTLLIAGGIGVAPLVFLANRLDRNHSISSASRIVLLGAKTKDELLCQREFRNLKYKVHIATEDGSRGKRGTVTALLKDVLATIDKSVDTNIYACGPKAMFWEINKIIQCYSAVNCQVSFEQFMGCGIGICCACSVETKYGYKKVCKDGPVFDIKDVW